jgi:hypothetical protein
MKKFNLAPRNKKQKSQDDYAITSEGGTVDFFSSMNYNTSEAEATN